MSDDRLADLMRETGSRWRPSEVPCDRTASNDYWLKIADAIRAAVAADPSIVGMERVYGAHGIRTAHWLAPSEGEVTR